MEEGIFMTDVPSEVQGVLLIGAAVLVLLIRVFCEREWHEDPVPFTLCTGLFTSVVYAGVYTAICQQQPTLLIWGIALCCGCLTTALLMPDALIGHNMVRRIAVSIGISLLLILGGVLIAFAAVQS